MSYDVTKFTNLGQMKSALQRINAAISNAKSVRTAATISTSNWVAYDNIWKYNNILSTSNYHYYDVHLAADTSNAISLMCANSDIRAKIEGSQINLYAYASKPTNNFQLEIITTPTSTNDVGLTYDIGDDFLVYPAITDALSNRITTLETNVPALASRVSTVETDLSTVETDLSKMVLVASDVTIATDRWTSTGFTTYPYKAVINMTGITSSYFPMVQFRDSDAQTYDFAPYAISAAGTVTVYCKTSPGASVVVHSIVAYKGTVVTAN